MFREEQVIAVKSIVDHLRLVADMVEHSNYEEPLFATCCLLSPLMQDLREKDTQDVFDHVDAFHGAMAERKYLKELKANLKLSDEIRKGEQPFEERLARSCDDWARKLRTVRFDDPLLGLAQMLTRFFNGLDEESQQAFLDEFFSVNPLKAQEKQESRSAKDAVVDDVECMLKHREMTAKRKAARLAFRGKRAAV